MIDEVVLGHIMGHVQRVDRPAEGKVPCAFIHAVEVVARGTVALAHAAERALRRHCAISFPIAAQVDPSQLAADGAIPKAARLKYALHTRR